MFPKILLVLGLAAILLVSLPIQGQCNYCEDQYRMYPPSAGWDSKVNSNTDTGECTLTATRRNSNGEVEQVKVKANEKGDSLYEYREHARVKPDGSGVAERRDKNGYSRTDTSPGGSKDTTTYDNNGRITSKTHSDKTGEDKYTYDSNGGTTGYERKTPDGSGFSQTFDPASCGDKTAYHNAGCNVKDRTETAKDGSKHKETYDASGKKTSETNWDAQGNKKTVTVYNPDGSTETATYYPGTGKTASFTVKKSDGSTVTRNYDSEGRPISETSYNSKTGRTETKECDNQGNCPPKPGGLASGVKKLPDGVKKLPGVQKSPGDPKVGKEKVKADVLKQIQDKPGGDLSVGKEKLKTGVLDKAKAGSLEVGTKADVLKGAREKVQTGVMDKSKIGTVQTKPKALDVTGTQKEKLSVTPRGKSIGQSVQGIDPAKKQIQTQSAQPFKAKPKGQDFGSPAGSPGLLQRPR